MSDINWHKATAENRPQKGHMIVKDRWGGMSLAYPDNRAAYRNRINLVGFDQWGDEEFEHWSNITHFAIINEPEPEPEQ